MKTLRQYVEWAGQEKKAIGHFNISNIEGFWAVVRARDQVAKEVAATGTSMPDLPVIIGASEGERDFIGIKQVVALVKSMQDAGKPVFLNADHTYSVERVKEAIDAGFDAVIFDGTEKSFDENVAATKPCVDYAHVYSNKTGKDVMVEAEIGFIGKSSKILDAIPEGVKITEEFLTKPDEAKKFVELTGVDMLAPAVGNVHGMLRGGSDPALNVKRIAEIRASAGVPLVLHGGSGGSLADFTGAIANGCQIVHISTELRVAFRNTLAKTLQEKPDEVAPYKYLKPALEAMQKVAEDKLRIFNKI